ncbi:MAG: hypothetical protein HRU15_06450 [Planctomycetes bacterium]|nr:hypothetical protein [Planctomycetota bacterium]
MLQKLSLSIIVLCVLQSCSNGGRAAHGDLVDIDVESFKTLRDYHLPTQDFDPQPNWAINDNRIIVRSKRGIGILDEGRDRQKFYNLKDARRIGWPTWLDDDRIMLASPSYMVVPKDIDLNNEDIKTRATESHVSMAIVRAFGLKMEEDRILHGVSSYYPRRINQRSVMAQKGESIVVITTRGEIDIYDQGFFAQPQTGGTGVAFQTVPVTEVDYWTGKKGNGDLIVRWKENHVSIFPNLIQARWCSDGGVLATRLNGIPSKPELWNRVDSDIVYIAPGSDEAAVVLQHAHSPSPHPYSQIAAVFVAQEGIFLLDYTDKNTKILVPDGLRPQWNFDGSRLLTEIKANDKTTHLRVWVFQSTL